MERLEPDDAVVMVWQGSDGVAAEAEKRGLQWINCPNGGGNVTAEFGRATVDFGDTPSEHTAAAGHRMNLSSPGLLGVQVNMWEQGWGYLTTKPHGTVDPPTTYVDMAVARSAGPGWWGKTWPRNTSSSSSGGVNATEFQHAYEYGSWIKSRLEPSCDDVAP